MTLTLTASTELSEPPAVRLVATSTTGGPSPIPNNTLVDVWRIHEDGSRHRVLTEQGPRLIGGGWTWLDLHAPFNVPLTYEVDAAGFTATSGTAWVVCSDVWLVAASTAVGAVKAAKVTEIGDRSDDTRSARFAPIGGKPVFMSDGARDGLSGSITLLVPAEDEQSLMDLFADDGVILINTPGRDRGWWVSWMWVQPKGIKWVNPANNTMYGKRSVVISFDESADPDVDFAPVWNSGQAALAWATSGAMAAAYANSLALVTDTRL